MIALLRRRTGGLLLIAGFVVAASLFTRTLPVRSDAQNVITYAMLYGGIGSLVLLMGGVVSGCFRSGAALLWLQKPVQPHLWFMGQFCRAFGLGMASVVLVGLLIWLCAGLGRPDLGRTIPRMVVATVFWALPLCSLVFALSCWNVRRDVAAALALAAALFAVQALATLSPETLGPLVRQAHWIGLPLDQMAPAAEVLLGGSGARIGALLHVLGWCGAWVVVGLVGLHRTLANPLPGET